MSYLTKQQLKKAFDRGYLDDVAKQLRTYGTITADKSFDIAEGYHAGSHRVTEFLHHGIRWGLTMHNGEVKAVEYNHD